MTILHRSDWENYPTAIVDYNTNNESFLRLAALYKRMGIKNCEFILSLFQPELSGIDPHSPDLSEEIMLKIALEAKYNRWYYFREVARVPPVSGTVPNQLRANRGNIALYWCFFNHIDIGLLQIRQTGKSISTDILMVGLLDIWADNTPINLITKDAALRAKNVKSLKEIRSYLPEYIYYPDRTEANNSEMVTNNRKKNTYTTSVGRSDRVSADKLGRGMTVPILHFDELAYISHIGVSLPVALSSASSARDQAAAADQPYGNIYTTTAGDITQRDGEYAYNFMTGGAPWTESYFDSLNREELVRIIERSSTGKKALVYAAFNHRQLGFSDEWLMRKLRETAAEGELADRDWFNIWTTGSEGSPLTTAEKRAVHEGRIEIQHMEITPEDQYAIRWYVPEEQIEEQMNLHPHALGIDPSDALGENNDATGMVITDLYTHKVIATGRYNETNLTRLGIFFAKLIVKYPKLIMIPERKSSGMALLDTILIHLHANNIDPFKRIYNRIVDDQQSEKTLFEEIKRPVNTRTTYYYDKYKRHFGYNTSGGGRNARDNLYGDSLKAAVRLGARTIHDEILANEILGLVIKNGRIDHNRGNHDDMAISWLLTHWFGSQARHLDYYGIDATKVFSDAVRSGETKTPESEYKQIVGRRNRDELDELLAKLKDVQDPMSIARLESRLRQLSRSMDVEEVTGVGIDAMLKQVHENKVRSNKLHQGQNRGQLAELKKMLI